MTINKTAYVFVFAYCFVGCYKEKNPELLEVAFFAGTGITYANYTSVAAADKSVAYIETFDAGAGNWWTGNQDQLAASVNNGHYILSNTDQSVWRWLKQDISLDATRNFELEAILKVESSAFDDGAGIALTNDDGDVMTLLLDHSDRLSLFTYKKIINEKTTHQDWVEKSWLHSSGWVVLTIRKAGDKYFFFADEQNIGVVVPTSTFSPSQIALFLDGSASMRVDQISFIYF